MDSDGSDGFFKLWWALISLISIEKLCFSAQDEAWDLVEAHLSGCWTWKVGTVLKSCLNFAGPTSILFLQNLNQLDRRGSRQWSRHLRDDPDRTGFHGHHGCNTTWIPWPHGGDGLSVSNYWTQQMTGHWWNWGWKLLTQAGHNNHGESWDVL